jgi:hypothetical protein
MPITSLSTTTTSAAVDNSQTRFQVGSTSGINGLGSLTTPQSVLIVGNEAMAVLSVPASGFVEVARGFAGTQAHAWASGATVYIGTRANFDFTRGPWHQNRVALAGNAGVLPDYVLPLNGTQVDPATGYEYVLVDYSAAMAIGAWVVISGAGAATPLASTSKGRVGVVIETIGASDLTGWVLVAGQFTSAQFTSAVTTACDLIAGAAIADILTTDGGNIIERASCISAPSSATDYGTVYMDHPWVNGVAKAFSSNV